MACDVITLVRQECKEINLTQQQHQQKRSVSARVCYKKRFDFITDRFVLVD
jgi:hypothetical protein